MAIQYICDICKQVVLMGSTTRYRVEIMDKSKVDVFGTIWCELDVCEECDGKVITPLFQSASKTEIKMTEDKEW